MSRHAALTERLHMVAEQGLIDEFVHDSINENLWMVMIGPGEVVSWTSGEVEAFLRGIELALTAFGR